MLNKTPFGHRKSHDRHIRFKTPKGISAVAPDIEKRRTERRAIWCVTYVHSYDANAPEPREVREAVLLDVSDRGVRVRSRSRAAFSEHVLIKVGRIGLHRTGRVVWQTGFDAGIEFD